MGDIKLEVLEKPSPVLQVLPRNKPLLQVLPRNTAKLVIAEPCPVTVVDISPNQELQTVSSPEIALEVTIQTPPVLQFVAGGLRPGGDLVRVSANDLAPGNLEQKVVAGTNVTLATLNEGANEQLEINVTIPPQVKRQDYKLNLDGAVPTSGTAYMFNGQVSTASAPLPVTAAGDLAYLAVLVDVADTTNDYEVRVGLNGATDAARTITLSSGSTKTGAAITGSLVALDELDVRLVRVAGSGKSDFREVTVILIITES